MVPDQRLGRQLALTAKYMREVFEARLAKHGATMWQFLLLRALAESEGQATSQRELAARMHIEGPTLVRHLDHMERAGLLRRQRDETDRRNIRVALTRAGHRRCAQLAKPVDQLDAELRALMSVKEQAVLSELLQRIYDHVTTTRETNGNTNEFKRRSNLAAATPGRR